MDLKGKTVLCTIPGRHGDILWALPTCRSIAQATGEPVALLVAEKYKGILPVVEAQDYILEAAASPLWEVLETAPMSPAMPPAEVEYWRGFDLLVHLGYQRWPLEPSLPEEILWNAERQLGVALPDLELERPWIALPPPAPFGDAPTLAVCWTDEWAELKMGVLGTLVCTEVCEPYDMDLVAKAGSRVIAEWDLGIGIVDGGFDEASKVLAGAKVVLSCNSALWVLAAGLGRPIVMMEPNPDRHNKVFLPKEWAHSMVLGGDGKPTFDARAVVTAIKAALDRPEDWKGRKC